ncbi:bifunctional helix-turn-helix transcriptional regulator/GNAT family N-acetyltransferase [Shewanella sp. AS1]|uniref:bifunctional helix-turn-helix transcriptional regulator/GNAT family N-acetyltransferase n=1 Tax=Shewanella sp. AS1 TaxID=2907626 RepID=UPI001F21E108|nr:bifunctional helix-turn-helix transcriptional regulator/GNAT family N-acetyltransferase [Shewanella sp. AS1]MCE9677735.1 bifunctional helix-turn-helix transcriptional regulator/GNAT family N-acetyltransferase [Shewanella sp. AS1]
MNTDHPIDMNETSEQDTGSTHDCSELRSISRTLARQLGLLSSSCGELPLSQVQAHALSELQSQELSIKQLAIILNIDKSNASRTVSQLIEKGLVQSRNDPRDSRSNLCQPTVQGKRMLKRLNQQQDRMYETILSQLSSSQKIQLNQALQQYSRAIGYANLQQGFTLRCMTLEDNPRVAEVIREVSAEYGLTADKGYSVADPTLDSLFEIYGKPGACYWVIEDKEMLLGGAGIAPLAGKTKVCELQKMYFLPQLRGRGFAKRLALQALEFARQQGYSACYLETTASLKEALSLYELLGFQRLSSPLGNTGHDACEIPMLLEL